MAYVVPIAVGVKWFPDKKGMITGLAVAGFGFGATLWVKLAGSWFGGLLNTVDLFGLPGVQGVFVVYGVVFLLLVGLRVAAAALILAWMAVVEPEDICLNFILNQESGTEGSEEARHSSGLGGRLNFNQARERYIY